MKPTPDSPAGESLELETLSSKFHDIYQEEARRQSGLGLDEVRHPDRYEDLPERTKEYDRVLARYVIELIAAERAKAVEEFAEKVKERLLPFTKPYDEHGRLTSRPLTLLILDAIDQAKEEG